MRDPIDEFQTVWFETDDQAAPDLAHVRKLVLRQKTRLWLQIGLDALVILLVCLLLLFAGPEQVSMPYLWWGIFSVVWGLWLSFSLVRERLDELRALTKPTFRAQAHYQILLHSHQRRTRFSFVAIGVFLVALLTQFGYLGVTRAFTKQDFILLSFGLGWLALCSVFLVYRARMVRRKYQRLGP